MSELRPEAFTEPRQFNLMFKTHMGPVEDESSAAYLRPETAQGMFVDFAIVQQTARKKVPFGIAQIGKSFRNEITPGNFIFRTREFEQMEMEFFVEPGTDDEWFEYWVDERHAWYVGPRDPQGEAPPASARDRRARALREGTPPTWSTSSRSGWQEIEGIANRTDFDLEAAPAGERRGPDLLRPGEGSALPPLRGRAGRGGRSRPAHRVPVDAYREEEAPTAKGDTEKRTYLALHRDLAPTKVAVLPLSRNEQLAPDARGVFDLVKRRWMCDFDDAGSIGRRYRRQDEVGTPFCVTVDFDTLEDRQVTVRERDSMAQDRIPVENLVDYLAERL